MIGWILKIKKNKVFFSLVIGLVVVALLDVVAVVVDVVQIAKTGVNAASLMGGFLRFNIFVIVLYVLAGVLLVVYVILKRYSRIEL